MAQNDETASTFFVFYVNALMQIIATKLNRHIRTFNQLDTLTQDKKTSAAANMHHKPIFVAF